MTALLVRWTSSADPSAPRVLVAEALTFLGAGAESRLVRHCPRCGSSAHGRPVLVPRRPEMVTPHVSISRADGLTVVAVTDAGPVGVDVESREATSRAGVDAITWVRTESLLKATGHGLGVDPGHLRLSEPHEPPALLRWTGPDPPVGRVVMFDLDLTPDHLGAVTVLAEQAPEMLVSQAGQEGPARRASS